MGRGDAKDALRLRLATVGNVWLHGDMALHRNLPAAPEPARAQPAFQKTSFGNKNIDIHLMSCHELQHICFVPWIGDGTAMNNHGDMILVTYFFLLVTYFFLLVTYFFLLVTNELLLVTYK